MTGLHWRLAFGAAVGGAMSLVLWAFVSEHSPAHGALQARPEAGYVLLVLDLPALWISRVASGTPPSAPLLYLLCFVQWFAIALAASFLFRRPPPAGFQAAADDSAASSRPRR